MSAPSQTHRPAHGGYPGEVTLAAERGPDISLWRDGYQGRVYAPEHGRAYPVGTVNEEWFATLATVYPDRIYFVTEEALS